MIIYNLNIGSVVSGDAYDEVGGAAGAGVDNCQQGAINVSVEGGHSQQRISYYDSYGKENPLDSF